ncbi:MAG: N-acetylmuramoyl-L-alanine amidase [Acidiferrobacterales bacterium]|nr:N-acetylmuramoyl-L-alanine amidase [Acidiferrobacterales bacterium]
MASKLDSVFIRLILLSCFAMPSSQLWAATVTDVRVWNSPERTRVVLDVSDSVFYNIFELDNPSRIVIDIAPGEFVGKVPAKSKLGPLISSFRVGGQEGTVRFVLDLNSKVSHEHFTLRPNDIYGDRLVVDISSPTQPKRIEPKQKVANKTDFLVVIDAGHGGEDPGAIGARKTYEKHLVLQISKKLKRFIDSQAGFRAELTRKGDYYIPLRRRTQIAEEKNADLFISIHADAFTRRSAHGVSVFALSTKGATSERARAIANKENSTDLLGGENLSGYDDAVVDVMAGLALDKQIERSLDIGAKVRLRLSSIARMHGNMVEQAGFVVLKAPQIPSILIEVGFISNPAEEKKLKTDAYQDRLIKGIGKAVVQFVRENSWTQDDWRTASN